jgi:hypothetical protein
MTPKRFPQTARSYPASGKTFAIDKTGTIYETYMGDLNKTAKFGLRVFRTKPGGKPEELFYTDGGGSLTVINKELFIGYTDSNWASWYDEIPGYIDPSDTPSSKVVNVDEAAMAVYKNQVTLAQKTANSAQYNANDAITRANKAQSEVDILENRVAKLEAVVSGMQNQILSKQQVEDIVWAKIWDVNYLIRDGFRKGSSTIREVQDYLVDLATYIKSVMK